ncbi:transposase family protein, partial [Nonomuraea sp. NPDC059022]|uniref:transposase family protein n=1 Tax=Nonomuraea sp. NPDC059022 TaxID=3346705 RepID=UPI003685C970
MPAACPGCGTVGRVHGYVNRQLADLPLGGQRVLVRLRFRRLRCATVGCERQTFREPLPGLAGPYQRRTIALATQVGAVVRELPGGRGLGCWPYWESRCRGRPRSGLCCLCPCRSVR